MIIKFSRLIFCCLLCFSCWKVNGQTFNQRLSDQTKISLLTMAPTQEIYNQFGHTALRVHDPITGFDYCFNYGVYDFNAPYFVAKFVRGQLNYMMAITPTDYELDSYRKIGRGVVEQDFNLTKEEVQEVVAFLRENYKEENRFYLYDFFYDNCATRIRDLFEEVLDTRFDYPENTVPTVKTFRELLEEKIGTTPWNDFGIDFILGSPTDFRAGFREEMFLPEYLANNLAQVAYQDRGALLGPPHTLVENKIEIGSNSPFTPYNLFWGLFLIALIVSWKGAEKGRKIFDGIFYFLMGFCGVFLLFMRYGTDHFATWNNFNLIWANPLFFILFVEVFKKLKWTTGIKYFLILLALATLFFFNSAPQAFHRAVIPILAIILLRLIHNIYSLKKTAKIDQAPEKIVSKKTDQA